MSKYIQINGIIETPDETECNDLMDLFLEWLENENQCYFGGVYRPVDENGNKIK